MSGDIGAINSWARSYATRANALAMNTGISAVDAKTILIKRDAGRSTRATEAMARNSRGRTGK